MLETTTLRRPHEIILWRPRDFNFDNKPTLVQVPSTIAKNDFGTETRTTSETASLLQSYIKKNHIAMDDLIFQRITENSATGAFRRYMKEFPELNGMIQGANRYLLHLYSFKKLGYTVVDKKLGKNYADGMKGDKNSEYHRLPQEEKDQMYLELEPDLTFFNSDLIRKELDEKHTRLEKQVLELRQQIINQKADVLKTALDRLDQSMKELGLR